jgi:hypothetical protein
METKDYFTSDRVGKSYQFVVPTKPHGEDLLTNTELNLVKSILEESFDKEMGDISKKFKKISVGRAAAGGGVCFSDVFGLFQKIDAVGGTAAVCVFGYKALKALKSRLGPHRRIIFNKQWLEDYCKAEVMKRTKEQNLKTTASVDLTGNNDPNYEAMDFYLFVFKGGKTYICLTDCLANIEEMRKVSTFDGVRKL